MGSLLRAIAAAVRSWFRLARGRRARLAAPAGRADLPESDRHAPSGVGMTPAPGLLGSGGTASLGRLDEAEVPRPQAEEAARLAVAAEDDARRRAEEEKARHAANVEARRQAEEDARRAAEAEAQRKAEQEQEKARLAAEAEARLQAEETARLAAEAEARRKAEDEEQARVAAEAEACRQAEADARVAAEAPRDGEDAAHPAAAEEEAQPDEEQEVLAGEVGVRREPAGRSAPRTRAPRYRAPAAGPPAARQPPPPSRTEAKGGETEAGGSRALPIELRLLFERGDYCRVTLLPRRTSGLPEELTLRTPTGTVDLVALQDDWYQDIAPDDLSALLRDGVVWRDEDTGQEWLLSGREIFVLAPGTAHRGLVPSPRLVLGREHAVLCATPRLPAVEAVLRQAGCDGWTQLDENDGAPRGWVVLRGVVPRDPVPLVDNADILNVLRPLPQIEIALEGGICLAYASWLAAHPPTIRVYGDPDHSRSVLIDGQEATASDDGCYTAPGWDSVGAHQVWCNGASRTYSLLRREPSSQMWAAFSFPSPGSRAGERIAICGPLVRAFTDSDPAGEEATREVLQVPPANPVLLGALPGQVLVTHPRQDVRGAQCIVSSSFAPVWALPSQPLLCNKKENRVRLVGEPLAPGDCPGAPHAPASRSSIEQWCRAIRDAGRKGLAVEPATPAATELWGRYKRYARDLWRRSR